MARTARKIADNAAASVTGASGDFHIGQPFNPYKRFVGIREWLRTAGTRPAAS